FLFLPFILAYFAAKLILPIINWMYRKIRMPRMISATILIIILAGLLVTAFLFLCRILTGQIRNLIQNMGSYEHVVRNAINYISCCCDDMFGLKAGSAYQYISSSIDGLINNVRGNIIPAVTQQSFSIAVMMAKIVGIIVIIFISVLMIVKDSDDYRSIYEDSRFYEDIHKVTGKLSVTGIAYIKTQVIIMLISAGIITSGLLLIKNRYALLIGIGISILDAFPVLGCGIVLIPWAIVSLIGGKIYVAAILITIYLICELVRQFLEPKLLGDRIGIKPIFMIMSMYIGVNLFGILGFLLGPVALVIIIAVFKAYSSE
ncbi:MAG TPA: AI-2E family transporter, partial [Lachnospiraceae bacterium]|nr:AI-2E family transporter [Lachnospiraceae bacterium]